ncbi:MAG: hypothetical protein Q8S13_11725, partial [Dehalococcoidia bacterium]|nr:hypothetical protein [Dehalococcoidia bacterium]
IEVSNAGARWDPLEPAPTEVALRALSIAAVVLPFGGRRGLFGRLLLLLIGQAVASRLSRPNLPPMPEGLRFGRAFGEQPG